MQVSNTVRSRSFTLHAKRYPGRNMSKPDPFDSFLETPTYRVVPMRVVHPVAPTVVNVKTPVEPASTADEPVVEVNQEGTSSFIWRGEMRGLYVVQESSPLHICRHRQG